MAYGLEINGFAFTYGALSVIAKGAIAPGATVSITKADHPDITDWRVVFTPTGVRDLSNNQTRPSWGQSAATVTMSSPSNAGPHNYLVLGR
jgi:hypothetical protein